MIGLAMALRDLFPMGLPIQNEPLTQWLHFASITKHTLTMAMSMVSEGLATVAQGIFGSPNHHTETIPHSASVATWFTSYAPVLYESVWA